MDLLSHGTPRAPMAHLLGTGVAGKLAPVSKLGPMSYNEDDWPCGRCGHVRSWHQKATWCRFEDCTCSDYYEAPKEEATDDLERGIAGDSGVGSEIGS